MRFIDYEISADDTASYMDPDYLPLGLMEEVGELAHEYARVKRTGKDISVEALISETGDVLWILSQIAKENGFTLQKAAEDNIRKLSQRNQEGSIHDKRNR